MLDVSRVGKRMNKAHIKKIEWKNIDSGRPRRSKEPRGRASALIIFNIISDIKLTNHLHSGLEEYETRQPSVVTSY